MPKPIKRSDRQNRDFLKRFFASRRGQDILREEDKPVGVINLLPEAEVYGTPTQYQEADLAKAGLLALREGAGMVPLVGEALDVAEFNKIRQTGRDFYGDEATPTVYAAITAGGLLLPNILERPLKAGWRALKKPVNALADKLKFTSEIDWSKWNPDTPNYPELIQEYNEIEKRTKRAGTWMKNPDGTDFEGSPEQFIQQQSSHFKRAFPDGGTRVYRGVGSTYHTKSDKYTGAPRKLSKNRSVFTSEDLEQAESYTKPENRGKNVFLNPSNMDRELGGVYDLRAPSGARDIMHDQPSTGYTEIFTRSKDPDYAADMGLVKPLSSEKEIDEFFVDYNNWARANNKPLATPGEVRNLFATNPATWSDGSLIKGIFGDAYHEPPSTNRLAEFLDSKAGEKYSSLTLRNIDDAGVGDVRIHKNKPGNYLKSNVGNVGFFDLNDPDVFKALVPIVGFSAAYKMAKDQGVENPGQEMSKGGVIAMKKKRGGMSAIRK